MCQNCKASDLGIARQAELDAATEACKAANVNPAIAGFLVRHAFQGRAPRGERLAITDEQKTALERYNAATDGMKKLHEDYVWERGRQYVAEVKARGVTPPYLTHGDKRS